MLELPLWFLPYHFFQLKPSRTVAVAASHPLPDSAVMPITAVVDRSIAIEAILFIVIYTHHDPGSGDSLSVSSASLASEA